VRDNIESLRFLSVNLSVLVDVKIVEMRTFATRQQREAQRDHAKVRHSFANTSKFVVAAEHPSIPRESAMPRASTIHSRLQYAGDENRKIPRRSSIGVRGSRAERQNTNNATNSRMNMDARSRVTSIALVGLALLQMPVVAWSSNEDILSVTTLGNNPLNASLGFIYADLEFADSQNPNSTRNVFDRRLTGDFRWRRFKREYSDCGQPVQRGDNANAGLSPAQRFGVVMDTSLLVQQSLDQGISRYGLNISPSYCYSESIFYRLGLGIDRYEYGTTVDSTAGLSYAVSLAVVHQFSRLELEETVAKSWSDSKFAGDPLQLAVGGWIDVPNSHMRLRVQSEYTIYSPDASRVGVTVGARIAVAQQTYFATGVTKRWFRGRDVADTVLMEPLSIFANISYRFSH
jgi:hypothetical protein